MRIRLLKSHAIAALVAIALLVCLFLWGFGPHFHYWLTTGWMLSDDIAAIPVSPLPETAIPADYVRCRFGSISFRAPRSMTVRPEFKMRTVMLKDEVSWLLMFLPSDNGERLDVIRREFAVLGEFTSIPRILAANYSARPADFRWSMTQEELARHRCFMRHRGATVATAVETSFGKNIEALLHIYGGGPIGVADYEWYGNGGAAAGTLIFGQESSPVHLEWIRAICASLEFNGEIFPENITTEELAKLFRVE
jgi:hypothetical protein